VEEIVLWWIGEGEASAGMIEHVRNRVAQAFQVSVRLHRGAERPADAFDARRKQSSSTRILKWVRDVGPRDAAKVLAITDADLFIPILTFVFGEAQLGGGAAVVSTARLAEPAGMADERVVAERMAKESVHELGHTFGLLHCASRRCAMGRAASVRDVDAKAGGLCEDCRSRLSDLRSEGGGA
jgi:archaemetzincin